MSEIIKTNAEYSKWIKEVSLRFRNSQIKAATKVNREMLLFYWSIGTYTLPLESIYSGISARSSCRSPMEQTRASPS